jgi:glycosyltransferase 2 family protein
MGKFSDRILVHLCSTPLVRLGLITPGTPGGLGVLEVTAIALLESYFSPGLILTVVALNRIVSILAEAAGAALAWLYKRWTIRL